MGLLRKIFGASKARDSQTPAKARSGAQHLDNSHVEEELPLLIKEGFGVKGVKVGRSTKDDVIAAFGKGYELITYGSYSTELKYKRTGLSFCYLNDDPEERVFSISVSSPCRAETERGISLNQRSLADVLSVYGSPTHAFLTTDTSDEWFFMYTSLGLIFQVKKDSSIPFDECPLSKQYKELHRNRRISAITVERPTATDIEEKESNVEAIFEEPVIPVSDYDSFEVTCAHCGWLSSSHYVLRMSLDKASRGEEISEAFGVEVSGLITQCTMPECRGYNRIMPNPSDPTSFTVVRYPSKEEEQHFKRRHSEVFPCGCPYCDPPKPIRVSGFHEARKIVNHSCCGR